MPTDAGPRSWAKWATLAAMFAAALLAYSPALTGSFIGDDWIYLPKAEITQDPRGWYRAWVATGTQDYYPVTYTLWWLLWRLWADWTPGYHLVNVALHTCAAWLIWRTLRAAKIPAAPAAAWLWLLHPLNVAGVAWMSELKDTLSMAFFVAAMRAYVEAVRSESPANQDPSLLKSPPITAGHSAGSGSDQSDAPRRPSPHSTSHIWYFTSLALFTLALLSKTAVVMGPLVLLLYDLWRSRLTRRALLRSAPFFLLSLILGLVTVWFQTRNAIAGNVIRDDGPAGRIAGAAVSIFYYLWKVVWPANLSYVYPKWPTTGLAWTAVAALVALAAACAFTWRSRGRHVALGLGYFVLLLLPILGLRDISFHLYTWVADHWAYHATLGPIALATAAAAVLIRSARARVTAAVATAVVLGLMTFSRAAVWRDGESLWRDTVTKNPAAWGQWNSLAAEVAAKGRLDEAAGYARRSLSINPGNGDAYLTLGHILEQQGDFASAEDVYRRGTTAVPTDEEIKYNLGVVLARRGAWADAEHAYRAALAIAPRHHSAHANLGLALEQQGRPAEAEAAYREDIRNSPHSVPGRTNLANLLLKQNKLDDAAAVLEGLADAPNALNTLGAIRGRQGNLAEAERLFRRATELNPDLAEAHSNLAGVLAARGDVAAARASYERALTLRPGLEPAVRGLENLPR